MFNKIERPYLDDRCYYSYGFKNEASRYQKEFHAEDALVDLINEKSGLIDASSTVRTLTNPSKNTIEIQLHFKYAENQDAFVKAMKNFLNFAAKFDLGLIYESKETMKFMDPYPTLTMSHIHLKKLISGLETTTNQPLNQKLLQGKKKLNKAIWIGGGVPTEAQKSERENHEDVRFIKGEIERLQNNAKSIFSINNKMKANKIEIALNQALLNEISDVRTAPKVKEALAIHRIFSFFGRKSTTATRGNENALKYNSKLYLP